ncbi:hypothetical protein BC830DRAFT_1107866 [Chytriomyces sp. MP71]|nr:hypothetical protein BC830DRAFT_1107866 [Chytriomyces sp. MP71]
MVDAVLAASIAGVTLGLLVVALAIVACVKHKWLVKGNKERDSNDPGSPLEPTSNDFPGGLDHSTSSQRRLSMESTESTVVQINGDKTDTASKRTKGSDLRHISSVVSFRHSTAPVVVVVLKSEDKQQRPNQTVAQQLGIPLPKSPRIKNAPSTRIRRISISVSEVLQSYASGNSDAGSINSPASPASRSRQPSTSEAGVHSIWSDHGIVRINNDQFTVASIQPGAIAATSEAGVQSLDDASCSSVETETDEDGNSCDPETTDDETSISLYTVSSDKGSKLSPTIKQPKKQVSWSSGISVIDSEILVEEVRRKTLQRGKSRKK